MRSGHLCVVTRQAAIVGPMIPHLLQSRSAGSVLCRMESSCASVACPLLEPAMVVNMIAEIGCGVYEKRTNSINYGVVLFAVIYNVVSLPLAYYYLLLYVFCC